MISVHRPSHQATIVGGPTDPYGVRTIVLSVVYGSLQLQTHILIMSLSRVPDTSVYTVPWAASSQAAMRKRYDFDNSLQSELAEAQVKKFQINQHRERERRIQPLLGLLSPNNKVVVARIIIDNHDY